MDLPDNHLTPADPGDQPSTLVEESDYPPKYQPEAQTSNVWAKSILSLAAYLLLGYYIFPSYKMLLLITAIVMIHEFGHFFAMKIFRYKDLGIFFIPLLGAYVSGSKREVSQRESAIILLAGPLPGIIIGIIMYLLFQRDMSLSVAGLSFGRVAFAFIFLNLINLLPVYPLDGGQLLNRVFLDEESWVSKVFVFLSIGVMVWFALEVGQKPFSYVLLFFPLMMLFRLFGDSQLRSMEKTIQDSGLDMDKSYDELPDEDYWRIRNILIEKHPSFKDVRPAPPYEYSDKEEKIMATIQSLLHRHLIQDVSIAGKLLIAALWIGAFVAPWFLNIYQSIAASLGIRI